MDNNYKYTFANGYFCILAGFDFARLAAEIAVHGDLVEVQRI